jgi:peptidyl-prolyl cis-trans isomerase D
MFDLFRSRDKAIRIMLGVLLGLVALSMLTYLIPNYDTGNTANDQVVAQVGKEVITTSEVQKTLQNTMRNRQLPAEIMPNFVPQVVQDLITERALAYEAQRLGYQVTDQELSDTIKQMAPSLFPGGSFVGKEAYAAMLAQQNLSIGEFEDSLRRQILVNRLRNVAVEGVLVTPAEIDQEYKKKNERIKLQWVLLKADLYTKESQPTADEIKTYYDANKANYMTPERRNLAILLADQTKLEQSITPTDAQLQAMYNQNKEQYRTQERVDVRHILFKTEGKPATEEAAIKAKAQDVLKQARAGTDFAELAKKYSEDPGSAQNGGLYSGVTRGQMVAEFEQAAFALKPGQISDLVKTQYGYHIVQGVKHDEAHLRTFDEVKGELAPQFKKQRATEQMQQIADKAQAALQKDPAHPEKVAADLGMELIQANGVESGKPVPQIGAAPDFEQSILTLKKGEISSPVALPNDRIALAVATDVMPPRPAGLEEVQNQIRDLMVRNRSNKAVQDHARELADKVKAAGGDLEKVAKSMGLTVKTSGDVERTGSVEGLGSVALLSDAFGLPEGSVFGPTNLTDGTVVGKVIQKSAADMSKLADQRASIRDEIKTQKQRDRNTLFEAGLRDALTKNKTIKIHQNAINSLIASYRS